MRRVDDNIEFWKDLARERKVNLVYRIVLDGNILYVGRGSMTRSVRSFWNHHNPKARELFRRFPVELWAHRCKDRDESWVLEAKEIERWNPVFNIRKNSSCLEGSPRQRKCKAYATLLGIEWNGEFREEDYFRMRAKVAKMTDSDKRRVHRLISVEKWQRELGKEFVELYADYKKNHAVKLKNGHIRLKASSREETRKEFRDSVRVLGRVIKAMRNAETENEVRDDVLRRMTPRYRKAVEKLKELF